MAEASAVQHPGHAERPCGVDRLGRSVDAVAHPGLQQPDRLMAYWSQVLDACADLAVIPRERERAERLEAFYLAGIRSLVTALEAYFEGRYAKAERAALQSMELGEHRRICAVVAARAVEPEGPLEGGRGLRGERRGRAGRVTMAQREPTPMRATDRASPESHSSPVRLRRAPHVRQQVGELGNSEAQRAEP